MAFSLSHFHPGLRPFVAKMSLLDTFLFYIVHIVDKFDLWHRLPVLLGLAYLGVRRYLHQRYNLLQVGGTTKDETEELSYGTANGSCNRPMDDMVGSEGTFFGRNMLPSTSRYGLFEPHPTIVASKLLARKKFKDYGKQFNVIGCSWIQFMIHDWVDHMEDTQQVEIRAPDEVRSECPLKSFKFFKSKQVSTGSPPITTGFLNRRTPWWDGSAIYGNNNEGMQRVRSFKDGKLKISGEDGLIEHNEKGIPISGDVRNYWAGFSLILALFVREHNAVCDMLKDINGENRPDPVDLAALEVYRDRERRVARYNEFRRNLLMIPITKWEDLTDDKEEVEALREVYGDDVEKLDLQVGLHAEKKIKGFAISETAFTIFLLMATRRLEADCFFTSNFNAKTYTKKGLKWVNKTETLKDVIDRHFPEMTSKWMRSSSAFSVWDSLPTPTNYLPLYLRPAT